MQLPEVHQPQQPLVSAFTARTVDGAGIALATRDYGGDGPALVLLHGAGMDQVSLEPLAEQLRPAFRVVTVDFRGHGDSGLAPWTLDSAVSDVGAVAESYGLGVPAVGGHSLGGMVALAYASQHPSCPAVINIDGHGRGRVEQYLGRDEDEVRQWWDEHDRRIRRLTSGATGTVLRGVLLALGKPAVRRETVREVLDAADAIDLFALYRRLSCPLLVFNATASEQRRMRRLVAGEGPALVAAYRDGLRRDLAALAAEREGTQVCTVDAPHMLIRTHTELVARSITDFLQPLLAARPA
jgi:pimeloyl-ACP methyl ester carboxylesterase